MKNRILHFLSIGLFFTILFTTAAVTKDHYTGSFASTHGALHVVGADLYDQNGDKLQLKGISTHGLHWFPQFVNRGSFQYFRDHWGANMIRLAMYTGEGGYLSSQEQQNKLKKQIQDAVSSCTDLGMYCIIDWHILSDGNPLSHVAEARSFFAEMSSVYKDHTNILYEICNEPNGNTSWNDIKAYAEQIIPVIHANDPDAVILVGTPTWSQAVDQAAADPIRPELATNIMYTLHFYAATHKDELRSKLLSARASGLPIFISEFSTCDASGNGAVDTASANAWFRLIKENNLSYAGWSLCNKNESSAILKSSTQNTSGNWNDHDFSETGLLLKSLMTQ